MGYLLIALIILAVSVALSVWAKRRIEETIPAAFLLLIFVLYVSGLIFPKLIVGVYLVCGLGLASLGAVVYSFVRRREALQLYCLKPGLFLALAFFVWMFLINLHRQVFVWDEFSHWALAVKNMCFFDRFAILEEANTTYKGYPPALSLWEYFVCKLTGGYSDMAFYNAISWFELSLFLPLVKKFDLKKTGYAVAFLLFMIFLPMAFKYTYMVVGYVDIPLGLLTGSLAFTIFTEEKFDLFHYLLLGLTICVLCLTKATGAALAVLILALLVGDLIAGIRERKSCLFRIAAALAGLLFGKLSWTILLKVKGVSGAWNTSNFTMGNLLSFLTGKGEAYWYTVAGKFWSRFFVGSFGKGLIAISLMGWTAVLFVLAIVLAGRHKENADFRRYVITLTVGELVYAAAMMFLYIFTFSEYEAKTLASYNRYMASYVFLLLFFILGLLFYSFDFTKSHKANAILLLVSYACLFLIVPFREFSYMTFGVTKDWATQKEYRDDYADITQYEDLLDYKTDKIALVAQEDNGRSYYTLKFEVAPVKILDFWSLGSPYYSADFYSQNYSEEEWLDYICQEGCTYVYVYQVNEYFLQNYADAFGGAENIKEHRLYRIENVSGQITLSEVEE